MSAGTPRVVEALADASRLRHRLAVARFAVAYGSHARGTGVDSDLDLLFVGHTPISATRRAWLAAEVEHLHQRHGLRLDEELSYEVKPHASRSEIAQAISFGGYNIDATGTLTVPPVLVEPAYLNSAAFKYRLIVNALTSPHLFLGGDAGRYRTYQARAARTAALVALSLLDESDALAVTDAVAVLIGDAGGVTGEDFLGYAEADAPLLYGLLQAAFADLTTRRILHPLDGPHPVHSPKTAPR